MTAIDAHLASFDCGLQFDHWQDPHLT